MSKRIYINESIQRDLEMINTKYNLDDKLILSNSITLYKNLINEYDSTDILEIYKKIILNLDNEYLEEKEVVLKEEQEEELDDISMEQKQEENEEVKNKLKNMLHSLE